MPSITVNWLQVSFFAVADVINRLGNENIIYLIGFLKVFFICYFVVFRFNQLLVDALTKVRLMILLHYFCVVYLSS